MRMLPTMFAAILAAAPLAAQPRELTPADSVALARAAAELISRELLPDWAGGGPALLRVTPSAFDSAVARHLRDAPELGSSVPDSAYALWMSTEGFRWRRGIVAVAVKFSRCDGGISLMNWSETLVEYEFAREGKTWRAVRARPVRVTDGHCGPQPRDVAEGGEPRGLPGETDASLYFPAGYPYSYGPPEGMGAGAVHSTRDSYDA